MTVYCAMAERVIHISETEASRNFADVLARMRAGAEVVIESGTLPEAVVRSDRAKCALAFRSQVVIRREFSRAYYWSTSRDRKSVV